MTDWLNYDMLYYLSLSLTTYTRTTNNLLYRADFDWSAIGLSAAEDAGIDVSADVARNRKDIDEGNTY